MANETVQLAEYAASLRFENLPAAVVCLRQGRDHRHGGGGDPGSALPWSRIVIDYAERTGRAAQPHSRRGMRGGRHRRRRSPTAGPRPCLRVGQPVPARRRRASRATVLPPALAVRSTRRRRHRRDLIAAFVAGNE